MISAIADPGGCSGLLNVGRAFRGRFVADLAAALLSLLLLLGIRNSPIA